MTITRPTIVGATAVEGKRLRAAGAAGLLCAVLFGGPAFAQGTSSKEAVDTIIGTEVQEEEAHASADADKVIAAIEKTRDQIALVRKTSKLNKVDIVFLADAAPSEGGPPPEIETKVKEHQADIAELRQEIEGNAMLFHAIDSRQILVRDVLAVEFQGNDAVIIYAAASKPAG
ncbi:MAG TPA: hypothetical protein VIZ90_04745 [Rhizobiaceae bacterium]